MFSHAPASSSESTKKIVKLKPRTPYLVPSPLDLEANSPRTKPAELDGKKNQPTEVIERPLSCSPLPLIDTQPIQNWFGFFEYELGSLLRSRSAPLAEATEVGNTLCVR